MVQFCMNIYDVLSPFYVVSCIYPLHVADNVELNSWKCSDVLCVKDCYESIVIFSVC